MTLSWWTFDGTGFLIPLLFGLGVWFLAIRLARAGQSARDSDATGP